jgi:hypothetical protein
MTIQGGRRDSEFPSPHQAMTTPINSELEALVEVKNAANRILSELDMATRVGRFASIEEADMEIVARAALEASNLLGMREALEWIEAFAQIRANDDSKAFSRVNRSALRTIAETAGKALGAQ